MAFNFNWSPLIADTILARDLLTTALNKTPKPPIIVDDIIVTELNLGSTPPDLTLLEVGDLAQDRFRGVFKVTYGGDAFLTLRTRVQANPLNTELQKRRRMGARGGVGWCEPDCLAADSGLTIPVAITLSDFVLSGFVILVFSRSKGLTLVFRNDPLESLKVSSTFDSIPFVRDYLQRTIEERLRALFMEDLPAILHRLSLRLWGEEGQKQTPLVGDGLTDQEPEIATINPLASPAQEPITCSPGDIEEIAHMMALAMDASAETESTFSQKNLLKLASLADSQRTLSLTTPAPRDVMFRAWATMADRVLSQEQLPISLQHLGILSRRGSALGSSYSSRNSVSADSESLASGSVDHRSYLSDRPSLNRTATSSSYIGLSERHRHSHHPQRKRKHRVINLRRTTTNDTVMPDDSHHNDTHGASSTSVTVANSPTEETATNSIAEEMLDTPRASTRRRDASNNLTPGTTPIHSNPGSTRKSSAFARLHGTEAAIDLPGTAPPAYPGTSSPQLASTTKDVKTPVPSEKRPIAIKSDSSHHPYFTAPLVPLLRSLSEERFDAFSSSDGASTAAGGGSGAGGRDPSFGGGVLEQAWLQKMKRETALRVRDEKRRRAKMEKMEGEREAEEVEGPPAYVE